MMFWRQLSQGIGEGKILSFKPYPFSHLVLTCWHSLSYFIECIKGCFSMFFDESVSFLYCFIICDACRFFSCTWMISQEKFMGASFGGCIRLLIMHKGCDGKPRIPVILSC